MIVRLDDSEIEEAIKFWLREKHGLEPVPTTAEFGKDFYQAEVAAHDAKGEEGVPGVESFTDRDGDTYSVGLRRNGDEFLDIEVKSEGDEKGDETTITLHRIDVPRFVECVNRAIAREGKAVAS